MGEDKVNGALKKNMENSRECKDTFAVVTTSVAILIVAHPR
jgi:hypothetical protein